MDYYKLFDLEIVYNIDKKALKDRYFSLQKQHHPDKVASSYDEKSAQINKGYRVLMDDFSRAQYLLTLQGFNLSDAKLEVNFMNEVMDMHDLKRNNTHLFEAQKRIMLQERYNNMQLELERQDFTAALSTLAEIKALENLS